MSLLYYFLYYCLVNQTVC